MLGRESGGKANTVTQRADRARIEAVVLTGGVWLDASCLCVAPVEAWVSEDPRAVYGIMVGNGGDWENWAFAARNPRNEFRPRGATSLPTHRSKESRATAASPTSRPCGGFKTCYLYLTLPCLAWLRVRTALPDAPIVMHPPTPFPTRWRQTGTRESLRSLQTLPARSRRSTGRLSSFGASSDRSWTLSCARHAPGRGRGLGARVLVRMGDVSRT